jgi:hypothetical protein
MKITETLLKSGGDENTQVDIDETQLKSRITDGGEVSLGGY